MNFSRSIQWLLNVAFLSPSLHIFMVNSRYFLVAFKGKPQIPMLKAHHFPWFSRSSFVYFFKGYNTVFRRTNPERECIYIYILAHLMNMNTQTPEYPSSLPPASRFGPCFLETTERPRAAGAQWGISAKEDTIWRGLGRAWSGIPSLGGMVSWWFHHVLWCLMMFLMMFHPFGHFFALTSWTREWPICSRIMNLWLSSYPKVLIDTH